MAIFHQCVKIISRASGRSAVAAASYRSGEKLRDGVNGKTHDYTRKGGIAHTEILAPEAAPEWASDREKLWNAVEASEKRKDAQLAREVEVALPVELGREKQTGLVRGFVWDNFVKKGMIADIAIHDKGDGNPHAHVMLTMRDITPDGFGKKNRGWNDGGLVEKWRYEWESHVNAALATEGIEARVDRRTLEAQGIERTPQIHAGRSPHRAEANERIKRDNETAGALRRELAEINVRLPEIERDLEAANRGQERTEAERRFEKTVTYLDEIKKRGWDVGENDCSEVIHAGMNLLSCDIAANGGGYAEARARLPHVDKAIQDARHEASMTEAEPESKAAYRERKRLEGESPTRTEGEAASEREQREGTNPPEHLPNLAPRTHAEAHRSSDAMKNTIEAKESEIGPSTRALRPGMTEGEALEVIEREAARIAGPLLDKHAEEVPVRKAELKKRLDALSEQYEKNTNNEPRQSLIERITGRDKHYDAREPLRIAGMEISYAKRWNQWIRDGNEILLKEREAESEYDNFDRNAAMEREKIAGAARAEALDKNPEAARAIAKAESEREACRRQEEKAAMERLEKKRAAQLAELLAREAARPKDRGKGVSR